MYPKYKKLGSEKRCKKVDIMFPPQHQDQHPGLEYVMNPLPISENPSYQGSGKLKGKVAIVTGGDSGIGRAVSYLFAKEGANVVIPYLYEHEDAETTKARIEQIGCRCLLIPGDLRDEGMSKRVVENTLAHFGRIDILINNHAVQFIQRSILDITAEQLDDTFRTNIYAFFFMVKAALPHMKKGSSIINTASVTAYKGEKSLLDYSATKGAIVSFTRSLSQSLVDKGIRVNGVAPGPVWTPLTPSSWSAEEVMTFGTYTPKVPLNRAAQPFEIAPCYVFLASDDSRYMTGQLLHPNGGTITST